ncbi:hypothetical protein SAMN06265360_105163 [Haloechinothrix alba]|uniref:Uncharacterized protein n=1 Tax=Haloechinothrix alba TaxID=664784 RepID=A0A238W6C8_9PSEU|nr:hypothetical protein SAMN06265360_105163 [Haloechinothrix alba]
MTEPGLRVPGHDTFPRTAIRPGEVEYRDALGDHDERSSSRRSIASVNASGSSSWG